MKEHEKNANDVGDGRNGSPRSGAHNSPASHNSHSSPPPSERLLPPRGDYQTLLSFQKAEVIYDITFRFAHKYLAKSDRTIDQMIYEDYREFVETRSPEVIANIAICLIHQTNYLIDQQVRHLEQEFLEQGGLRERMTRARIAYRNGTYGKQGNKDGKGGRQGSDSDAGSPAARPKSSPDSPGTQSRKPPDRRPPQAPGGQP